MSFLSPIDIQVPDAAHGYWRVESFEVSEREASLSRVRMYCGDGDPVPAGTYKRLMRGGTVVMSNTPMEIRTHRELFLAAHRLGGHVLLNGLGLGMALSRLLTIDKIERVTVVEKSAEVLALVGPTFSSDPRVSLVHADAFDYAPPRGTRYSCVWHDIWDAPYQSNLKEMAQLKRKYARRCRWQACWEEEECRYARF